MKVLNMINLLFSALRFPSIRKYELSIQRSNSNVKFLYHFNFENPTLPLAYIISIIYILLYGLDCKYFGGFEKYHETKLLQRIKINLKLTGPYKNNPESVGINNLHEFDYVAYIKYGPDLLETLNNGLYSFVRSFSKKMFKENKLISRCKKSEYLVYSISFTFDYSSPKYMNDKMLNLDENNQNKWFK